MTAALEAGAPTAPGGPQATLAGQIRSWWPWVVALLLVIAGAAIAGNPSSKGPPLDPSATSPQGAKALRLLLQREGAQVAVQADPPQGSTAEVVLVLHDQLDAGRRADLAGWVRAGGTLVVADPRSELAGAAAARAPGAGGLVLAPTPLAPSCDQAAVADVQQIEPSGGVMLRPAPDSQGCFTRGDGAYVVIRRESRGVVIALGGPLVWTNGTLGKLDNSVLATDLLVPRPGVRLAWLNGTLAGGGRRSLVDLIPDRVVEALAQLAVALVLLALWRGRRLGRPVLEPQAVELPGSELVVAVGNLLHQGHKIERATAILRGDLARRLAERAGVSPWAPPLVLAQAAAARTGLDPAMILATLAGPAPTDEAGLIALAQAADRIRQEVAHAHEGRRRNVGR